MILIFVGLPGTGKDTVAEIIAKRHGFTHFSMGAHLRKIVKEKGPNAKEIASYIDKGSYIPSELAVKIFTKWFENHSHKNLILDRFPGNIGNARAIEGKFEIDRMLNFVADEEILIDRLSNRIVCEKCGKLYNLKYDPPKRKGACDKCGSKLVRREDDRPNVIKVRIEAHKKQLNPLVDYYGEQGLLTEIDANFAMDDIDKIIGQVEEVITDVKGRIAAKKPDKKSGKRT